MTHPNKNESQGSCYLAIDHGTSSCRTFVYDDGMRRQLDEEAEIKLNYPHSGWIEQDPEEMFTKQVQTIKNVLCSFKLTNCTPIVAAGIANQRETVIIWNKYTGTPVYPAILWCDCRTQDMCNEPFFDQKKEFVRNKTALYIHPYFSASKIKWILDNVQNAKESAYKGDLLFGTPDTWLLWNLTNRKVHATDHSNASRTMLYNIHTCDWDEELCQLFGVPMSMLPKLKDSDATYGNLECLDDDDASIPITAICGDQQAALFGHNCFVSGDSKVTLGTSGVLLVNTGSKLYSSCKGMISTVAWKLGGEVTYSLEGTILSAGSVVTWLQNVGLIRSVDELEPLVSSTVDNMGVYLVPAFSGLAAPHWNSQVEGTITGLKLSTRHQHIVRAALESVAYQLKDAIDAVPYEVRTKKLFVDGRMTNNKWLMEFMANLLQQDVNLLLNGTGTSRGIAMMSKLGALRKQSSDCTDWLLSRMAIAEYSDVCCSMPCEIAERLYAAWDAVIRKVLCANTHTVTTTN